jgi:hypothetical protein
VRSCACCVRLLAPASGCSAGFAPNDVPRLARFASCHGLSQVGLLGMDLTFSLPSSTYRRAGHWHPMPCNADSPRGTTIRHHVSGSPFPCRIRLDANHESERVRASPRSKPIHACGRFPVWISTHRIHGSPRGFHCRTIVCFSDQCLWIASLMPCSATILLVPFP